MSTFVNENCLSFFQSFCIKVIKTGRIPQHIAIIMDGNRRYAKKNNLESTMHGHAEGYNKVSETLKWCIELGIPEVTVYAYSIENFKRNVKEVNAFLELTREKFEKYLMEMCLKFHWSFVKDQILNSNVRVHVVGRLSFIPDEIRTLFSKVMFMSKDNKKLRLNFAFAYTGRDEISRAASYIVDGVKNKDLLSEDVDEHLVSQCLDLTEPELLIRTSGEVRLSDFMLWQVQGSVFYCTDVLWPEFTIWNLLAAIIYFQRYASPPKILPTMNERKLRFFKLLTAKKWQNWQENASYYAR